MIVSTHGLLASSVSDINSGYFYKTTTSSSTVTGTTSNTSLISVLVPANTAVVNDFFRYNECVVKVGTNNSCTARLYINTTNSLSGATILGVYTINATTLLAIKSAYFFIKSATSTEILSTGSVLIRDNPSNNAPISINIDWTVNQYLIFALQNASTLDSTYISGAYILKT